MRRRSGLLLVSNLAILLAVVVAPERSLAAKSCYEVTQILRDASRLVNARKYQAAAEEYRRIFETSEDESVRQAARVRLGECHKKLGRLDDAIRTFREVVDHPEECEEAAGSSRSYSIYKQSAQFRLALTLLEKTEYAAALEAFRISQEVYPARHFCGNELNASRRMYTIYEGICREGLGDHGRAVAAYVRAGARRHSAVVLGRVVDLYEAAGRLDDLPEILLSSDESYRQFLQTRPEVHWPLEPQYWQAPGSCVIRDILIIREQERSGNWEALVDLVDCAPSRARKPRPTPCYLQIAAQSLARHPREAVSLLEERLRTGTRVATARVLYALGLIGTREAVAALARRADAAHPDSVHAMLVVALRMAGPPGEEAIEAIYRSGTASRKKWLKRIDTDDLRGSQFQVLAIEWYPFPPIPDDLSLPSTF